MFFPGTLSEGISAAVQDNKTVVCFVTGEAESDELWETEYLCDPAITDAFKTHAIVLRLKAGTDEASYLSAIFPVPKTPTVVIIKNGELKEYLTIGTTKEQFVQRVKVALGIQPPQATEPTAPTTSPSQPVARPTQPQSAPPSEPNQPPEFTSTSSTDNMTHSPNPVTDGSTEPGSSRSTETGGRTAPEPENERSTQIQNVFAERAARLKAQREEAERKAKEARAKAAAELPSRMSASGNEFAEAVKKKQKDAAEERRRILQRIEDDKTARRERQTERALAREGAGPSPVAAPSSSIQRTSNTTALQVRLFDGSTLRSRFPSSNTLREHVRKWIEENNQTSNSKPYRFKVVLAPLPNRTIDDTEEDQSLTALGLSPSATLLLIPVTTFATARSSRGQTGILGSIYAFFASIWLTIVLFLSTLVGRGPVPAARHPVEEELAETTSAIRSPDAAAAARNRRPLDREHQQRDYQLYNGNSLNFEPRPDDE